jgi:hypothetical protein
MNEIEEHMMQGQHIVEETKEEKTQKRRRKSSFHFFTGFIYVPYTT